MSDRAAFERERLVSLIIEVGMMRRDVAVDVADAILRRQKVSVNADPALQCSECGAPLTAYAVRHVGNVMVCPRRQVIQHSETVWFPQPVQ